MFSLTVLKSLLSSNFLVATAVVILNPVSNSGKKLVKYCGSQNIRLIRTDSLTGDFNKQVFLEFEYDFILSAHFQKIIPKFIFHAAKIAALNLHPSLLPQYRGMSPQHWPIINGDETTGVSVHLMEDQVDSGNIIEQIIIPLPDDIYIHEFQKKLLLIYKTIMLSSVERCIQGYSGVQQSQAKIKYYGKIRDTDRTILGSDCVATAYGKIRAFSLPYSGAIFTNKVIFRAKKLDNLDFNLLHQTFGTGFFVVDEIAYLLLENGGLSHLQWHAI